VSDAAIFERAAAVLQSAGLSADEIGAAVTAGPEELARTVARYLTFPGRRHLRPVDVWTRAGVSRDTAVSLWRAMGFPEVPDDAVAFTDADVDALRSAVTLFERAGMNTASGLQQARSMSQATMRIAASHQDVIGGVTAGLEPLAAAAEAVAIAEDALPALDHLLVYLYRRHLAAATEQQLATTAVGGSVTTSCVGFADLVGFTETTGLLSIEELAQMVERFNATTAGVVADGGGRVVKTIGDEVMFSAVDPADAVAMGLELLEAIGPDAGYPALRVGLATGEVLAREGDLFGPAVNLASRLVAMARPATMLVDAATRDAVAGDNRLRLTALTPRRVRGLGTIRTWRLRPDETAANEGDIR
jgi:adenylate cyclase